MGGSTYIITWRNGRVEPIDGVIEWDSGDFHLRLKRVETRYRKIGNRNLWKSRRIVEDNRSWSRKADGILFFTVKEHND